MTWLWKRLFPTQSKDATLEAEDITQDAEYPQPDWMQSPWVKRAFLGLAALFVLLLIWRISATSEPPPKTYHTPRLEDGRIIPGRME
ncbi:hypothetical protein MAIT1_02742 [Magnetofaba australis IT-1]|uniref:Uncharacterized protein n=2 Tax=Magnetofaba TaxID=1472292 RepID=A0A1Y2K3R8_9PROT|nr:hypothetical protein MAIT1_02742 [Magnetofaba australis IT-1]